MRAFVLLLRSGSVGLRGAAGRNHERQAQALKDERREDDGEREVDQGDRAVERGAPRLRCERKRERGRRGLTGRAQAGPADEGRVLATAGTGRARECLRQRKIAADTSPDRARRSGSGSPWRSRSPRLRSASADERPESESRDSAAAGARRARRATRFKRKLRMFQTASPWRRVLPRFVSSGVYQPT